MKSLRFLDRRVGYSLASLGLLLGIVAPSAFPAFAAASGQLDSRSMTLSSSAADASGVTYELKGTTESAISATGGLIIEFCSDSPLIGLACTHPSGLNIASVSADSGTATDFGDGDHATIKWVSGSSITTGTNLDLTFSNIHNPTAVGTFYARVTTYDTAFDYVSATDVGTTADQGAVALSTTDKLGITAYVRESMTFCVTTDTPTASCGGVTHGPSLTLGEDIGGGAKALDPSAISQGTDMAQLSTNAANGAVVNLQSDATGCGGLYLNGNKTKCNIAPQATASSTFTFGTADFGLKVGSQVNATGGTNLGTLAATNGYDGTNYFIDYDAGDATGVTSTYGSPIFSSTGPVSNENVPVTFGASVSNTTAAGIYGATLSMIATGTF